MTHEEFVTAIADVAAAKLSSADQDKVRAVKLCYGNAPDGTRGITYFDRWNAKPGEAVPFVAINALHQESIVQLAGTTLHELGHVLAGWEAGHRKEWHEACDRLGLRCVKAAGTNYTWAHFAPDIRNAIVRLPRPVDGAPLPLVARPNGAAMHIKPCGAGFGTKGGKSRGAGSGSRLKLWECGCVPPMKVRVARPDFDATCNCCDSPFVCQAT
jgi:hypothetical protein